MMKTIVLAALLTIAAACWWTGLLSNYQHQFSNGAGYALQGLTISRDLTTVPDANWEEFSEHAAALGQGGDVYPNVGFSFILAGIYSMTDSPRLWHACLPGFIFFMLGALLFSLLILDYLKLKDALLVGLLGLTGQIVFKYAPTPMTDSIFFGLGITVIWLAAKHPKLPVLAGAMLGLAYLARFQAILLLPMLWIFFVRNLHPREIAHTAGLTILGFLPALLAMQGLEWLIAPKTIETGYPSSFYLERLYPMLMAFSPIVYFKNINVSIMSLSSLTVLTPILWFLPASLLDRKKLGFPYRLRWFLTLSLALLVSAYCLNHWIRPRHYLLFMPLIVFAGYQFAISQADHFKGHARLARVLVILFCIGCSSLGLFRFASGLGSMSLSNLDPTNYETFAKSISDLDPHRPLAVFSTTSQSVLFVRPDRKLVFLPAEAKDFITKSDRNHDLGGLVFVLPNLTNEQLSKFSDNSRPKFNLPPSALSWSQILDSDVIEDSQGNRFTKVFEQHHDQVKRFLFKAVL